MEAEESIVPVPRKFSIDLIDLALLIYHSYVAAEHPKIGNNHAYATLEGLVRGQLNKSTLITRDALEAALYNANMLQEEGLFMHPHFDSFDALVKDLLHSRNTGLKFDKFYNRIYREKDSK